MSDPLTDEIRFHIEERTRELVAEGYPPDEARRAAEAAFGDVEAIRAELGTLRRRRERRSRLAALADSVAAGTRGVLRRPRHAALIVATLGVGLGAAVAMFTVLDAVLLDPLPFQDPGRLVRVLESDARRPERNPAPADFLDIRAQIDAFSRVTAFVPRGGNLVGEGTPERVRFADVAANFFETMGVQPRLGGGFGPEPVAEGVRVAVISHGLWVRRWGADPDIVGRTLDLNGEIHEIVGVAPEGFRYPADVSLWVPAPYDIPASSFFGSRAPRIRDSWYHTVVGRLAPEAEVEGARSQLAALQARLRADHPESFGEDGRLWLRSLQADQAGDLRTPLLLLFGATGLVLLIVVTNVATLTLVRAQDRAAEWSVRRALGAPRSRITTLVLVESLVLGLAGGLSGVAVAVWSVEALAPTLEPLLPVTAQVGVDPSVLVFALLLAVAAAVGFGTGPAVAAGRTAPGSSLDLGAGARTGGRREGRLRATLVGAQVALSVVLVLGAGLLLRSLVSLRAVDMGFKVRGLTTLSVGFPGATEQAPESQIERYDRLTRALAAIPGVEALAWGQFLPSEVGAGAGLRVRDQPDDGGELSVRWHAVSAGYFPTTGMALLEGRAFAPSDRLDTESVAVVNETLAERFFPGGDAVGRLVNTGLDGPPEEDGSWARVVGVVADARNLGPERPPEPMLYRPIAQMPQGFIGAPRAVLHLRSSTPTPALLPAIRRAVAEAAPDAPVDEIRVGPEIVAPWFRSREGVLALVGGFAAIALLLGGMGIYGMARSAVQRRSREIGVRMAMGADHSAVTALVVRQGVVPALAGLAVGLSVALLGSRALEGRLGEVSSLDPATWLSVPVILVAVAVVATWLPARRAARIDPVEAIRAE